MANMNEVFELVGKVRIDSNGVVQSIEEISDTAKKNSSKFGKFLSTMGETAVKVGKTIAKGMAVGATGISILTKGAVDAYAEYEQLVGGVETLFKESSSKVLEYASQAFKNQGMSANDYMETVTSFSASLLQGLGNDTEKAVEYANMAITDMSDNANKMGTDIENIQNAYQGFAKQNYTMLD